MYYLYMLFHGSHLQCCYVDMITTLLPYTYMGLDWRLYIRSVGIPHRCVPLRSWDVL